MQIDIYNNNCYTNIYSRCCAENVVLQFLSLTTGGQNTRYSK